MSNSQIRDLNVQITVSFNDGHQEIIRRLQTYGVCVVTGVLDETECSNLVNGMVSTLSYVTSALPTPFNIQDRSTWKTLDSLYPTRNLIYQNWGLGQSQFVWDVRTNPKIISIFEQIYQTQDLLVSFDGFSFLLPPELSPTDKNFEKEKWYHFDQSLKRKQFECIQGWVNGFDTNHGDATLDVIIGSHNLHQYYDQIHKEDTKDWVQIHDTTFFTSNGCIEHRIVCPKGSLVLWDSRTAHCGAKPLRNRPAINYRAVVYVCYTPRSLISEKDRRRKVEIFEKRGNKGYKRVTNHWPHRPVMFSEVPYIRDGSKPNILPLPDPVIDPKYRYLIGY